MRRALLLATAIAACALPAGAAADVPPGATARCNDGTYSFSATHSGTCSHHGGVAQWLDGSGATSTVSSGGSGGSSTTGTPSSSSSDQLAPHCEFSVELGYGPGLAVYFPFAYAYLGSLTTETLHFGDGTSAPVAGQLEVNHAYVANGSYQASLSCADDAGRTSSQTETVTITDLPTATVASTPATATVSASAPSATATSAGPPAGATARCADGSYSFSQHRSGTCSRHGGVQKWLNGGPAGSSTSTSSRSSSPSSGSAPPSLGRTVLLARRTRTGGCRLGPNPDRRCSPGAYYSGLTKAVICSSSFHTSSVRNVPESEKHQAELEYGLSARPYGRTLEIDHIISLELGGSNDIANIYPEEAVFTGGKPGYHVKDRLENATHDWVCEGKIGLRAAQRAIATNWQALYRRIFGVVPTS